MAYQHAELNIEEEEKIENEGLKEYYQGVLPQLKSFPVRDIDPTKLRDIAVMLHATQEDSYSWQKYLTHMGITNPYLLMKIKVFSYYRREPPLVFAMCENLSRTGNFGQIINALLKTEQFNILRLIQPYVKELLDSKGGEKKASYPARESLGLYSSGSTPFVNDGVPWKTNSNPGSLFVAESNDQSANQLEHQVFQQCSLQTPSKGNSFNQDSSDLFKSLSRIKPKPSAPAAKKITVLIMHTEFDRENAVKLSEVLIEKGFIVICLFHIDNYISTNASDALDTFFYEVDFVVPVVSPEFLQQIYPKNQDIYLESRYAKYNNYLFQLIRNDYINNRCRNYRVKPVIVPGMSRRLLVKENILSSSFRLPDETDSLIMVLQDTIQLNLQNMDQ